ncbi:hypothetical protein BS78_K252200 [Paspalum vaginatum]|uniref:Uncharacterized protein n=1 Tax=Paspalum vaginatum TaxID=158149 RepID=A0A9W7X5I4_9POAL|nr:hypothetical protein BS78_K252200 [Paspalum vaginatum]
MHTNFSRSRAGNSISGFFPCNELHKKLSYSHLHGTANHDLAPDLFIVPSAAAPVEIYITSSCNGLLICRRPAVTSTQHATTSSKFIEVAGMPQDDACWFDFYPFSPGLFDV